MSTEMVTWKRTVLNSINRFLSLGGVELRRTSDDRKAESLPFYAAQAGKAGMDVNDWLEKVEDWGNARALLESEVFPLLAESSIACEVGPGTGRFSRHLAEYLVSGQLYLVDHSPWLINFLQKYFRNKKNVVIQQNSGNSLPFDDNTFDLVLASGVFIELGLQLFYCYSSEFNRVLKDGGFCVLDYFDISSEDGWRHLKKMQFGPHSGFTYHSTETIDRIFISAGFEIVKRHFTGASTYLVLKKIRKLS